MERIYEYESDESLFETHYIKGQTKITIPRGKINALLKWLTCDIDKILGN